MVEAKSAEAVRGDVARAYGEAIGKVGKGGAACCGPACCSPADEAGPKGYEEGDKARHAEAAGASFGCGNPIALADLEPGDRVVDLGSGAGFDLLLAAEKVGPSGHVIGVDMTPAMIAKAWENIARSGFDNVEVRRGLIEALPVEDASVDRVVSNCVVNLSPEKERVFREIARVLRPGGSFSIADLVVDDLPPFARRYAAMYAACIGGAVSEDEYVAGLRAAGLEDVQVADRVPYGAEQIRALVESDLEGLAAAAGLDVLPEIPWEELGGKVASIRVVGRRP